MPSHDGLNTIDFFIRLARRPSLRMEMASPFEARALSGPILHQGNFCI